MPHTAPAGPRRTAAGRTRRRAAPVGATLVCLAILGCGTAAAAHARIPDRTAPRLRTATRTAPHVRTLGVSHPAADTPGDARVGALFHAGRPASHFCTAAVVDSPAGNLVVTAAHCLSGGAGDVVFVPGYRDGTAPYGTWRVLDVVTDPRWDGDRNEDLDVAFAVVESQNGRSVEDVVGGDRLGVDREQNPRIRLVGYPNDREHPIACTNAAEPYGAHQLRIACTGYTNGTSGGPWLTDVDPATGTGTVVGVIGGHERGGATADVSYTPYFGEDIAALYQEAAARAE